MPEKNTRTKLQDQDRDLRHRDQDLSLENSMSGSYHMGQVVSTEATLWAHCTVGYWTWIPKMELQNTVYINCSNKM